ncbi:MAG: phage head morphogenesis protein, partial [Staphylococcus epidermidis]|nr:phage head morphogenesis protein [Staphylococcus epidermidis]
MTNNKDNPKITNQNDIDNYIDKLVNQAEKEIKQIIANMYEKYDRDEPKVTWTEFNKYNRLNKELNRIGQMLSQDYREVAKAIKQSQQNVYIEKYMMSLFLYEVASQTSMNFDIPTSQTIQT